MTTPSQQRGQKRGRVDGDGAVVSTSRTESQPSPEVMCISPFIIDCHSEHFGGPSDKDQHQTVDFNWDIPQYKLHCNAPLQMSTDWIQGKYRLLFMVCEGSKGSECVITLEYNENKSLDVRLAVLNSLKCIVFAKKVVIVVATHTRHRLYTLFSLKKEEFLQQVKNAEKKFTIQCRVRVREKDDDATKSIDGPDILVHDETTQHAIAVLKRFEPLLLNEKYSDVRLVAGGKHMPAHWVVLHAASPVFEAVLQSRGRASPARTTMEVPEVQPDVLQAALEYMYCGRISPTRLTRWAAELWFFADRFEMPLLKRVATNQLKKGMTDAECLQLLLTLATGGRRPDNEEEQFLNVVLMHYHLHCERIFESAAWAMMKGKDVAAVCELQQFITKRVANYAETENGDATTTDT